MDCSLSTERLRLRPLGLGDAAFVLALVNTEGWLAFIGDRGVGTQAEAELYIQKVLDAPGFSYTVFERIGDGELLGIVTFLYRDPEEHPDIGFALLPTYEGVGYAHEATAAYLAHLRRGDYRGPVIAITKPANARSISLLQRLGLRYWKGAEREGEMLAYFRMTARGAPTSISIWWPTARR